MEGHGHGQGGRPCTGSIFHQTPPPPPNPLFHTPSSFPPPPPANHYNHNPNPNPNPSSFIPSLNPNPSSFIPSLNPNPNPSSFIPSLNPNPNPSSFIPSLNPNPNPTPYFHNPCPPSSFNSYPSNPNTLLPQIDSAVAAVRRNLIQAGENVSLFKVSHSVLSNLRLSSWESLGIQLHHVPSLNTLSVSESKINAFIHCYVAAHTITTLFDLEAAICKNECVNSFDDLELGPFLRHPLVLHYFSLSPDFYKLPNITAHDVVSHLSHFFRAGNRKNFKLDGFLHFIADKYQVNNWDKLGLRIQSLGMHIAFLRQAHASNDLVLDKCTETLKEESTKPKWNRRSFFALEKQQLHDGSNAMDTPTEKGTNPSKKRPLFIIQKQQLDDRFSAMTQRVNSFASVSKEFCGKHIRFVSSSDEDSDTETNISDSEGISDINVKSNQGQQLCSQKSRSGDKVSSCPYPSVTEEMTRLGLKQECSPSSNHSLKRKKTSEPGKKRRKSRSQTYGAANGERLPSIPGDSKTKKGNNPRSGSDDHLSGNDSIRMFITTWKEACREHNASEVFEKILQFHKMSARRQKRLQSLFSSYPLLGLLNVAVSSIKDGMWDSMYDTFQTIGELVMTNAEGNEAYENIDVDPVEKDPALNKKALKASPCAKVDDIMRKVSEYLAENALLSGDDSLLDIVLMLAKQLCHCEVWLAQQFSVKEFKLLGHGDFFSFLKTHASLIPKQLLEFVRDRAQEPQSLEASISREQLAVLVSQASSNLWEDNAVTKDKIFEVLCRQFPIINFKITGTKGVEELLDSVGQHRSSITSSCIVFSSTLMEASCNGNANSFDESNLSSNTGFVTDHGQVVKSLGSVMTKDAVEVLLKAPFLLDLNTWSHWDHVYAPSLGPLPNWLLTEVNAEGLLCVLTRDGKIIRVDSSASPDLLFQAILEESPLEIAVQLLSLLVLSGGKRHASMSLLKCQARQAFEVIMTSSSQKYNMGISGDQRSEKKRDLNLGEVSRTSSAIFLCTSLRGMKEDIALVSRIAIDSLFFLPAEFRSFAAEILLAGLQSGIKDVASAVLRHCKGVEERLMLHDIGFSLGIVEWIHDHNSCCPIISHSDKCLLVSTQASPLSLMDPCTKGVEAIEYPSHEVSATAANQDELCKRTPSSNHLGCPDVDSDSGRDIIDHQQNEAAACFIESIRREEFGLDPRLSDVESSMLKKQHARLGRALNCLSQELYSTDSHFLLELVQNADDNVYPDSVEPTLAFILQHSGVIVLNNERGFTPHNIRALCDVGNSTKKGSSAGYIGQKGIGFKSVFRVTDAPEIHSNGFHIKFDISEGQIGFVLPSVVTPCNTDMYEQLAGENDGSKCGRSWNTCIVLPFKSKLMEGSAINNILAMFSDLHPSLLLFLHRLRCIKLRNMLNDSLIVMRKEVLGDGIVKVSHGKDKMTWFVASNKLLPKVFRSNAQMTEISIALTLNETERGDYEAILKPQPVFSFLPLRSYGLKFILQADFILPSSREEVDGDSPWNQWLLSEFPGLFVNAEKPFCALPCFQQNPAKAVSVYMSFVPLAGEVHGFFSGLPRMIISKLRHSSCLLQDGYPDKWLPPCKLLRGWNEPARTLLSDSLLHDHLGLAFLDKDIYLSDAIARALGVEDYGPRVLVQVISSLGHSENGIKTMGLGWLLSWITELSDMLHSYAPTSRNSGFEQELLLSSLKKVPFIPLSDGTYGSVEEGAIWFNSNYMNTGVNEVGNEAFPHLHGTLRVVSHTLFSEATGDIALVNNCTRLLQRIGVQQMSAHDLIRNHILPSISDIKSAEKDQQLLTDYVAFIILHLQSNCKDCNVESEQMFSELCNKAIILTNYGYKRPSEVPIHFGREYGSCIDANKFIHGFDHRWHEVDPIYLKHPVTKTCGLQKWREFLQKLGVTDFVKVVMVEKSVADVSSTVLNQMMCDGNYASSGWVVKDWESPELFDILSLLSMDGSGDRCRYLLEILDSLWDDHLSDKVFGCCSSISGSRNILFKSSFMQCISEIKWIPSSIDSELHYPTQLFYDCDAVRFLLGSQAAYAVPKIKSSKLVNEIGFKTQVTRDDALCSLQSWQRSESPFTASLLQMSRLYEFIWKEPTRSRKQVGDELESGPFIFVPYDSLNTQEDVGGVFLSPGEVYWKDPTGALDCHADKSISVEETNGVVNKTLCTIYPGLHDFFVKECGVNEYPPLRHYLRILQELSRNALPSNAANIVFQVFLRWSDGLKNGALTCDDMSYLKECLLQSEFTVLPAMQDKWVSLHSSFGLICWCDDEMLKKEFKYSDNIEFLYFGELSDHEKEMLHSKVSVFLQNIGIPAISKIVSREAIYHGSVDCGFKTSIVGWVLPFAQRYIFNLHPEKYDQFKLSGSSKLHLLSIVVVEKLFYRNVVKEQNSISKKRTQCSSLLQGNMLYTSQESDSHSMFMELSRLFFDGTPELHLANFLQMITTMAESGSTRDQIEFFILNSQKMVKLPDDEPVWTIPSSGAFPDNKDRMSLNALKTQVTEQNTSVKSSKNVGCSSWPPVDWKTAPGFNHCGGENKFMTQPGATDSATTKVGEIDEHSDVATFTEITEDSLGKMKIQPEGICEQTQPSMDDLPDASNVVVESISPEEGQSRSNGRDEIPGAKQAMVAGRLGEVVAFRYLSGKFGGEMVNWVNQDQETGLPYDIVVGEEEDRMHYFEVKASRYAKKDWFVISTREWQFAVDKGDSFSIAHVILNGQDLARITIYKNPVKLCQLGKLQLAVTTPKLYRQPQHHS